MTRYRYPDYMKKWRAANADHIKESRRRYYSEHRDKEISAATDYQKNNPEMARLYRQVACANRYYPGTITIDDWRAIIAASDRKCHWCRRDIGEQEITLEHLRPENKPENITIACLQCNCARYSLNGGHQPTEEERRQRTDKVKAEWKRRNRNSVNEKARQHYADNIEARRAYYREYYRKRKEAASVL